MGAPRRSALAALALTLFASRSQAEPGPPHRPPYDARTGCRRPLPDYDRSGPRSRLAEDLALALPRTLLLPLHATVEYLVRRPLGALVTLAERHHVPRKLHDALTWGPDRASAIVPTALVDFGLRPSIGLYLTSDRWLYRENAWRLHLATGGPGWYRVSASFRHHLGLPVRERPARTAELHVEVERRPDRFYWGVGPSAPEAARARYASLRTEGTLSLRAFVWRRSSVGARLGFEIARADDERGEVRGAVDAGRSVRPVGFGGYDVGRVGLVAVWDHLPRPRPDRLPESDATPPPRTGARVALHGELVGGAWAGAARSVERGEGPRLLRFETRLAAAVDVLRGRVLTARATLDLVEPLARSARAAELLPFDELATLGGNAPLRGFLPGRLLGQSATSLTVEYAWPVWVWLDGVAHYGVGNAFGAALDGARVGLLRQSFGFGLRTNLEGELGVELLVAAGTETFDAGGAPESFRLVFGSALGP